MQNSIVSDPSSWCHGHPRMAKPVTYCPRGTVRNQSWVEKIDRIREVPGLNFNVLQAASTLANMPAAICYRGYRTR